MKITTGDREQIRTLLGAPDNIGAMKMPFDAVMYIMALEESWADQYEELKKLREEKKNGNLQNVS